MIQWIPWINSAFGFGAAVMYGALGETITEKSGNMNLGIPGTMCIGGAGGFAAVYLYEYACKEAGTAPVPFVLILLGLLCGFLSAALAGLLFSFFTTTLRVNQNVTGLTLTIFGAGLSEFIGQTVSHGADSRIAATCKVFKATPPFAEALGPVGKIFFNYGFMFYLIIVLCVLAWLFFNKTRPGLHLRAVGENPATADAAGINVTLYKYLATVIGSGIAGLGGVFCIFDYINGAWSSTTPKVVEAIGWLSLALVIFSLWRPRNLIWGALVFGLCYKLSDFLNMALSTAQVYLIQALPYVITIAVLVITSLRKKREHQPPASLGTSYFREDR